jgi:hypothetical protein
MSSLLVYRLNFVNRKSKPIKAKNNWKEIQKIEKANTRTTSTIFAAINNLIMCYMPRPSHPHLI